MTIDIIPIHYDNYVAYFVQVLTMKCCRDCIGGSDHSRIFVKWLHEACFICPSRILVRYDELTQAQWTAGITAIAAEEKNPIVQ